MGNLMKTSLCLHFSLLLGNKKDDCSKSEGVGLHVEKCWGSH